MIDLPVWVWVVSILGVIAAGIGLGYLIIVLFWRLERLFSPPPPVVPIEPEVEPESVPEPVEAPEEIPEPVAEPPQPEAENETKEELEPVMPVSLPDGDTRFIKFTTVLHARFGHPFSQADTIVCWDIGLENGDEVRDSEGSVMTFRVIESGDEPGAARHVLTDESGEKVIKVISGKEYMEKEANLHVDKMKLPE